MLARSSRIGSRRVFQLQDNWRDRGEVPSLCGKQPFGHVQRKGPKKHREAVYSRPDATMRPHHSFKLQQEGLSKRPPSQWPLKHRPRGTRSCKTIFIQLALIEALPKKVQATYSAISSGFYDEDELSLAKTTSKLHQTELKTSSNMRMFSKNVLREQLKNKSEFVLESNKFFVVATVGCFEEMDCLAPLNLPTRKSALRMFLEKI